MSGESQYNYTASTTKRRKLRKLQTLIESDRFIMLSPTESEEVTYAFFLIRDFNCSHLLQMNM